jgi:hypothetical protein
MMKKNVIEDDEDQLTANPFPLILVPANLARVPVACVILNFCDALAKSQPRSGRHGLRQFGSVLTAGYFSPSGSGIFRPVLLP